MTRQKQAALIILATVIIGAVFYVLNFSGPVSDFTRSLLAPFGRLALSVGNGVNSWWNDYNSLRACEADLDDYNRELASVSVDYVRLRALEEENATLRKSLEYLRSNEYDSVMAHIISRTAVPQESKLVIDRGSQDGLENGMAVVVEDGVYVGKITSIRERTSIVTMASDPDSRLAIARADSGHLIGLLEGRGNNAAVGTLIPQNEVLLKDDILVTAGTEEKIPANLSVGFVNEIFGSLTDPFKTAAVEPLVNAKNLNFVFVLRPPVLRPGN